MLTPGELVNTLAIPSHVNVQTAVQGNSDADSEAKNIKSKYMLSIIKGFLQQNILHS